MKAPAVLTLLHLNCCQASVTAFQARGGKYGNKQVIARIMIINLYANFLHKHLAVGCFPQPLLLFLYHMKNA